MTSFIVSDLSWLERGYLQRYVTYWIKHPDPESEFGGKTRLIRRLPEFILLPLMMQCHYDGIILADEVTEEIIGHVFFQHHGNEWKMFHIFLAKRYRGKNLSVAMIELFLSLAFEKKIARVRLGTLSSPAMRHICEKAVAGQLNLPFMPKTNGELGWVKVTSI